MKILLVAALTADGFIAQEKSQRSTTWTSSSDKRLFMRLAKQTGVIIMGMTTMLTTAEKAPTLFTKSVPGRRLIVYTNHPDKAAKYPAEIETTQESPEALVNRLDSEGVKSALVAGGAQIYRQFLQAGVVDELFLNYMPQLFGTGISLLDQPFNLELQLLDSQTDASDGAVTLHYAVKP